MNKLPAVLLSAACLALGLAACGSSSSKSSPTSSAATSPTSTSTGSSGGASAGGGAGTLSESADASGALKYTKSSLTAKAGKVTINFTNSSPVAHNMTIQKGTNGSVVGATPTFNGGSKTLTVTLQPGKYTFFCSVPGHRQAGMVGTLTVS